MLIELSPPQQRSTFSDPELAVARAIIVDGPISRTGIAEFLGLSQPSLTRLVKPLLASGLVMEDAEPRADGPGRPSKPLIARADAHRFIGIKLTGDQAFGVAVDLRAEERAEAHRTFDDPAPRAVVDVLVSLIDELRRSSSQPVEAVGISLGGSARDGRLVDWALFLDWRDVPLAEMVEREVGLPVIVDNDVLALTAAEHWFGEGRGLHDFAVVTIGIGIGLGLVRRDEVARPRDAGYGVAGHVPLDPYGPLCPHGHRGCSTAMFSVPSMCAQYAASVGRPVDFRSLLEAGKGGEPRAVAILRDAGSALGRMLALVSNLALVESIILTGDGLGLLDVAEDEMRAALVAGRDPEADPLDLRVDRSDFVRWARGAAAVAIQSSLPRILSSARG